MYTTDQINDYLLVKFQNHFTYHDLRIIIQQELLHLGLNRNNIWLVGEHRPRISIGELLSLSDDMKMLPHKGSNRKIAIVVAHGLTEAIMGLLAKALGNRPAIECRIFHTVDHAKEWLADAA